MANSTNNNNYYQKYWKLIFRADIAISQISDLSEHCTRIFQSRLPTISFIVYEISELHLLLNLRSFKAKNRFRELMLHSLPSFVQQTKRVKTWSVRPKLREYMATDSKRVFANHILKRQCSLKTTLSYGFKYFEWWYNLEAKFGIYSSMYHLESKWEYYKQFRVQWVIPIARH